MKSIVLIILCLITFSCNHFSPKVNSSLKDSLKQDSIKKEAAKPKIYTLNEIKMVLLDSRVEKANIMLGIPDKRGTVGYGATTRASAFLVYFDKVNDGGVIKNLLIVIDADNGVDDTSQITSVKALFDGETVIGITNMFTNMMISKKVIKSNSYAFKYGDGTESWDEVKFW